MPREISSQVAEHFTYVTIYSYSECGNYDDTTGYATCNACKDTVMDEYSYPEEDELELHKSGACVERKAKLNFARIVGEMMKNIFPRPCEYCACMPCDCPF